MKCRSLLGGAGIARLCAAGAVAALVFTVKAHAQVADAHAQVADAHAQVADAWNEPASDSAARTFLSRFPPGALVAVPEFREHPLRLLDALPRPWTERSDAGLSVLHAGASPGEYFVFQIGVFAPEHAVEHVRVTSAGLGGPLGQRVPGAEITCFNTDGIGCDGRPFTTVVNVERGRLQPLWLGLQVPPGARGLFAGEFDVTAEGGERSRITLNLEVAGAPVPDGGVNEDFRLARLRWLNSTIAMDERPPRGLDPIRRAGSTYRIFGRDVTIGDDGLPASINSFFTGSNQSLSAAAVPVTAGPIRFVVERSTGSPLPLVPGGITFTRSTPKTLEWESSCVGEGIEIRVSAHAECDGFIDYHCALTPTRDMAVRDIRLEVPLAHARYMMGLGRMGGTRPERFAWKWDVEHNDQDMVWVGDVNAGLRLKLKAENYRRPLINIYYAFHPLNLPASWGNAGRGGVEISSVPGGALLLARSGARVLGAGEQLNFDFELLVTPFRLMDRNVQFGDRYYHTYADVSEDYIPEALAKGANIINIHHKSDINPFINYPYLDRNVPYLKAFVDSAHARRLRVKVYYTTRELTVNIPEFWALRSLGGEVIFPGPGNATRTLIHPNGPPAWMQENLKERYIPAWVCDFTEGRYRGVHDAAVITSPDSRWNNFYLAGLDWMARNVRIDGVYVDDCALDRTTMQRARKILDDARPAARIDLHSWNHFCALAGWASCLNIYMDLLPYIDLVWIGEMRDYNLPADNWLIEVAGIPFGLPGQMLADGGNKWRGMVFGITNRLGWTGPSPDPLWKFWDAVGIEDMEMIGFWDDRSPVRCTADSVHVTVYRGARRTLFAVGNWGRADKTVRLDLDIARLGFSSMPREFSVPPIAGYQDGATLRSLAAVQVPGARGLLIVCDNH